jgi:multiple antibiotic resistance protein
VDDFLRALVVLFALVDPLGNLIAFHAVTRTLDQRQRVTAAVLSCAVAFLILLLFALTGTATLDYLGISLPSFQVASGLLLLLTAVRLVERGEPFHADVPATDSALSVVLVPLATPLLAGPGAIAVTVTFTTLVGRAATVGAAAAILALTVGIFLGGAWLFERAPRGLLPVLTRVVGILLTAIAVDLALDGLRDFFG